MKKPSAPRRARPMALVLPHVMSALGAAVIFLYFLDRYKQGSMSFMYNPYTSFMACALGALGVINGASLIYHKNKCAKLQRKLDRRERGAKK